MSTVVLAACATTGDSGGGADHLPVSGTGPFRRLAPDPSITRIAPPLVLSDANGDLDHPSVLAIGGRLELWLSERLASGAHIVHTSTAVLTDGFGAIAPVLEADQAWEMGSVDGPAVIAPSGGVPWMMFYRGGNGAFGYALSDDGTTWHKAPGPTLQADGASEGDTLGAPTAARIGDRVRVYYAAGGALWAAEARVADLVAASGPVAWARLDGDDTTPARDPMLAASQVPFATSLGDCFARVAATATGETRHDLYFVATTGIDATPTTIGYAGSWTGDDFLAALQPSLTLATPSPLAPTETPWQDGAVLLYAQPTPRHQAIAAAVAP